MRNDEPRLIGTSAAMRTLDHELSLAARSDAKVLVTGETGVGKDLVAQLIHHRSLRRGHRLATINCAGLPDSLIESELFGHVRGSFTGAYRDHAGLLEGAHLGTVFLDEVGDMSSRMQGVLLRFLETGELQRVGAVRAHSSVNVRVIAATNRDLLAQTEAGTFRTDLYYRLSVIGLEVPLLRERLEDVPLLLDHFLEEYSRRHGVVRRILATAALDAALAYRWPGNVRELKNAAERIVLRAAAPLVQVEDLPAEMRHAPLRHAQNQPGGDEDHSLGQGLSAPALMLDQMLSGGESFWSAVHAPFMSRDLSREHLREVVRGGLERTRGNYRMLVELFNMRPEEYKRFLGFLTKHDCRVPFHPFRLIPGRAPAPGSSAHRGADRRADGRRELRGRRAGAGGSTAVGSSYQISTS